MPAPAMGSVRSCEAPCALRSGSQTAQAARADEKQSPGTHGINCKVKTRTFWVMTLELALLQVYQAASRPAARR